MADAMSDIMWWAQKGEREQQLRAEYEAARKDGWEAEYDEWIDSLDEDEVDDER